VLKRFDTGDGSARKGFDNGQFQELRRHPGRPRRPRPRRRIPRPRRPEPHPRQLLRRRWCAGSSPSTWPAVA
jgi:hypothetical protein